MRNLLTALHSPSTPWLQTWWIASSGRSDLPQPALSLLRHRFEPDRAEKKTKKWFCEEPSRRAACRALHAGGCRRRRPPLPFRSLPCRRGGAGTSRHGGGGRGRGRDRGRAGPGRAGHGDGSPREPERGPRRPAPPRRRAHRPLARRQAPGGPAEVGAGGLGGGLCGHGVHGLGAGRGESGKGKEQTESFGVNWE